MKYAQTLLFIAIPFVLIGALDANAQQVREMQSPELHDFECMKSLECIQDSQSLKGKGWSFIFDETVDEFAGELTARMKGDNISLMATYDKEGQLIASRYKRIDVALPNCLLAYLTESQYEGWQIIGSEMVIKDFDPATSQYTVFLENATSVRSEKFDYEFVNDLHLKHEGLAKHSLF